MTQFIILESSEIFGILGYAVYFEIIELRFLGLNRDLKKNIRKRSFRETPLLPIEPRINEILEDSYIDEEAKNYRVNEINDENEY